MKMEKEQNARAQKDGFSRIALREKSVFLASAGKFKSVGCRVMHASHFLLELGALHGRLRMAAAALRLVGRSHLLLLAEKPGWPGSMRCNHYKTLV
jgi:hypothetical protein